MTVQWIDDMKVAVREVLEERDRAAAEAERGRLRAVLDAQLAKLQVDLGVAGPLISRRREAPGEDLRRTQAVVDAVAHDAVTTEEALVLAGMTPDDAAEAIDGLRGEIDPVIPPDKVDAAVERAMAEIQHRAVCTCTPMAGIKCRPHIGTEWASWVMCDQHHHDAATTTTIAHPLFTGVTQVNVGGRAIPDAVVPEVDEAMADWLAPRTRAVEMRRRSPEARSAYTQGWDAGVREALRRIDAIGDTGCIDAVRALLPPFELASLRKDSEPIASPWEQVRAQAVAERTDIPGQVGDVIYSVGQPVDAPATWRQVGTLQTKRLLGLKVVLDENLLDRAAAGVGDAVYVRRPA